MTDTGAMPGGLRPMLARPGPLPSGAGWAFEVKWDGIRALVCAGATLTVLTRTGRDVTARYPELADLGRALPGAGAVLDGEIVAFDPATGRPSFERLGRRMHAEEAGAVRRLRAAVPVTYAIFDLLWLDGRSTVALPYRDRRRLLDGLALAGPAWRTPASHEGDGEGSALLDATRAAGLEGVVAKRLDSPYEPGVRSRNWVKVKNQLTAEFVVGGWLPGEGARARLGALLVGVHPAPGDPRLVFAGRVGTGFSDAELARLGALLEARRRPECPFQPPPGRDHVPGDARWVTPDLVAEVAFAEWTTAGLLRHPSYKGLRSDVDPADVAREPAVDPADVAREPALDPTDVAREPALDPADVAREPAVDPADVAREPAVDPADPDGRSEPQSPAGPAEPAQ